MPMLQDPDSEGYYGKCDVCGLETPLISEDDRVAIFLIAEKFGWFVIEDGSRACCSQDHWDEYEISHIDEIIGTYGSNPELN